MKERIEWWLIFMARLVVIGIMISTVYFPQNNNLSELECNITDSTHSNRIFKPSNVLLGDFDSKLYLDK